SGAPTVTASPSPSIITWSKSTLAPGSPASLSTTSTSPGLTRYCLPPVLITAYIEAPMAKRNAPARGPAGEGGRVIAKALLESTPSTCVTDGRSRFERSHEEHEGSEAHEVNGECGEGLASEARR